MMKRKMKKSNHEYMAINPSEAFCFFFFHFCDITHLVHVFIFSSFLILLNILLNVTSYPDIR